MVDMNCEYVARFDDVEGLNAYAYPRKGPFELIAREIVESTHLLHPKRALHAKIAEEWKMSGSGGLIEVSKQIQNVHTHLVDGAEHILNNVATRLDVSQVSARAVNRNLLFAFLKASEVNMAISYGGDLSRNLLKLARIHDVGIGDYVDLVEHPAIQRVHAQVVEIDPDGNYVLRLRGPLRPREGIVVEDGLDTNAIVVPPTSIIAQKATLA